MYRSAVRCCALLGAAVHVCVADGWWRGCVVQNPEATARQFIDGWFHTGDIGVKTPMDEIWIIDR
jgi:long-subunit acyl-CoA synthetase (AMP-forming)